MWLAETSGCPLGPGGLWAAFGDPCSFHQRGLSIPSSFYGPQTAQSHPSEWGWAGLGQALQPMGLSLPTKDRAVRCTPASCLEGLSGVLTSLRC